ncbi:intermembrane phospholipid transport protein YdbH family protein [Pararhodospirillum photometricum]|uniref:Uncharacterized protein n=1 Tax=Pararhodospirillum photometricum DSM 122 TaxID=1150469 RepID=H6SQ84_PARPM|nr:YdbH domain-containing protein [Pararhodospirillum photometricum]CCG09603.1 Putative uncharacterized protein [Pararhodospirillum photometricum DSM 122]
MPRLRPHPSAHTLLRVLALVGLGAGGVTLVATRLSIAEGLLAHALPLAGLPAIEAQVSTWGLDRLVIEHARTSDGRLGWRRLDITLALDTLWTGRVREIALEAPQVTIDPWTPGDTPLGLAIPAQRLSVTEGQITVKAPEGDKPLLIAHVEGQVESPAEGPRLSVPHLDVRVLPEETAGLAGWTLEAPLTLRLDGPALMETGPTGTPTQGQAAVMTQAPVRLGTPWGPLTLAAPRLDIRYETGAPPALALVADSVRLGGGEARGVEGHVTVSEGLPTVRVTARLERLPGETSRRTEDSASRPLPVRVDLVPQPADGEAPRRLALTARVDLPADAPALTVSGWTSADGATGDLRLANTVVPLSPQGMRPTDFHQALGEVWDEVTGGLRVEGGLAWDRRGLHPALTLGLETLDGLLFGLPVTGVNAQTRLDRLWPVQSPWFEARVALLSVGLPLRDGLITMRFDGRGKLAIDEARFVLAGGTVSAQKVSFSLKGGAFTLPMTVLRVSLAEIADVLALEGLDASGHLSGQIPLRRAADGTLWIDQARLDADQAGTLRYRPPSSPGAIAAGPQGLDMLLAALDNFQYKSLSLTLDGPLEERLKGGLTIEGANPDLYNGYPFHLTIALDGALSQLIRQSLRAYTLPERLKSLKPWLRSQQSPSVHP